MQTRTWDNAALLADFSTCNTLSEVLSELDQSMAQQNEVVCEVRVNGVLLSLEDENRFGTNEVRSISELAVKISASSDVVEQARISSLALIEELLQGANTVSDQLRHGNLQVAHRQFTEIVEATNWLVETLIHLKGAYTGNPWTAHWADSEVALRKVIMDMSRAYSSQDLILVADILEYELTAALDNWKIQLNGSGNTENKDQPRDS